MTSKMLSNLIRLMILAAVLITGLPGMGYCSDVSETLNFGWQDINTIPPKEWRLFWSDQSGGPYGAQAIAVIPFPDTAGPDYSSPVSAIVSGSPATMVRKFFVLQACADIPQKDGSTKFECSGNSIEAFYDFWIPYGQYSAPVVFRIVPKQIE